MFEQQLDELIPYDWTFDQAHAVVNLLEDLAEAIWSRYVPPVVVGNPQQLMLPLPPRWWLHDATIPF
jgi:hypothetical protein